MKYLFSAIIIFISILDSFAQVQDQDTLQAQSLPEVIVNGANQIETPRKTILRPTALERKHATNGFELLDVINSPELEIDTHIYNITTKNGGSVVICVNGMEVSNEEVAMLRAKNVQSIEYIRTPGGKYAGKAGVINFITTQYKYGGNVYLSAEEGFAYKQGNYLGYMDYTYKGLTLSVTTSFDWNHDHSYSEGVDKYVFSDRNTLERSYTPISSSCKTNNQGGKVKLTSIGSNHRFNIYASFVRQAIPQSVSISNVAYSGMFKGSTLKSVTTQSRNISPSVYANYTMWLPKEQTLDFIGAFSYGENRYSSLYNETGHSSISTESHEKNRAIMGKIQYFKTLRNNYTLTAVASHDHNYYKDTYNGNLNDYQTLITDVTTGMLQISKNSEKYYFYLSTGISNTAVSLNTNHYDYCHPIAFYGGNYIINSHNSLSLNGLYTHTLFNPSDKNKMVIRKSFFEVVKGNPDLGTLRALNNTLSYNGQFGKSKISVSYNNIIYFDNICHVYSVDENTISDTRVNDGTLYGNILTVSYSYNAFNDKLRLNLTAIEEYNALKGKHYNIYKNILRARLSATYLIGNLLLKATYKTPYTTLFVSEPYFTHRKPVYELSVSWKHKAFSVEGVVRNPFKRYNVSHSSMNYGYYNQNSWSYSESDGRCVNLKLTYNMGYGKKTEQGEINIDKSINNALLKAY
ncbi:MAG: hypothetical protein SOZ07_05405 [Prevotella sp.]|nr:hypothetical protein [Prevotellaceae bacterium]MDY3936079.1 hypothetical protein [Prevotella sp.]